MSLSAFSLPSFAGGIAGVASGLGLLAGRAHLLRVAVAPVIRIRITVDSARWGAMPVDRTSYLQRLAVPITRPCSDKWHRARTDTAPISALPLVGWTDTRRLVHSATETIPPCGAR